MRRIQSFLMMLLVILIPITAVYASEDLNEQLINAAKNNDISNGH